MLQEVPGRRGRRIALIGIGSLIIVIILIILLIMIIIYIARHTRFRIPIQLVIHCNYISDRSLLYE